MKIKTKILKKFLALVLAGILLFQPFIGLRVLAEGEVIEPEPTTVAENTQTGEDSINQAEAENSQPTTINNENNAVVENNVDTTANTGDNCISPEATDCQPVQEEGVTSQGDQSSELSPTPSPEPTLTPLELTGEESQGDGSGGNSETAVDPLSSEEGILAENEGTGENSENLAVSSEGQITTVVNDNQATVENNVCSSAETGSNTVTGEDSKIDTGDANAEVNSVNVVNTNLVGQDFWQAIINLFGTSENDIDLTQIEGFANFDLNLISILSTNANTGDGSVNIALANLLSSFAVYNINTTTLINQINLLASTGNNQILGEDGSIETGNASASLNLFNLVNTNLVGEDWFFGLINLFGELNGDIILPYELQYLGLEGGETGQVSALNENTGDGSTNQASASDQTLVDIDNTNNACLTNNVSVTANTGDNDIIGDGEIQTGNADASANLANIVNTNIFGSRWLLLIINNYGGWTGNLIGWWGNLFSVGNTIFAWVRLPDGQGSQTNGMLAENQNTGDNSQNYASASENNSLLVNNNNTANIQNEISVTADTGHNQIVGEDGAITTGNAQASSNVLNMVNTNIIGNHWFFAVINIFGGFLGDIIFPRPDLVIGKSANKSSVTAGEEIIYTIAYQNIGRLWANETVITDYLPAGESFVSCSDGGVFDGGRVIWNLGKILAGQGGSLTVSVRAEASSGTALTNSVGIATSTNEPKQDNNFALATTSISQGGSSGSSSSGGSNSSSSSDGSTSSSTSEGTSELAVNSFGIGGGTGQGFYPETLGVEEVLAVTEEGPAGAESTNLPKTENILLYVILLLSSSTYIFFWVKPRLGRG